MKTNLNINHISLWNLKLKICKAGLGYLTTDDDGFYYNGLCLLVGGCPDYIKINNTYVEICDVDTTKDLPANGDSVDVKYYEDSQSTYNFNIGNNGVLQTKSGKIITSVLTMSE